VVLCHEGEGKLPVIEKEVREERGKKKEDA